MWDGWVVTFSRNIWGKRVVTFFLHVAYVTCNIYFVPWHVFTSSKHADPGMDLIDWNWETLRYAEWSHWNTYPVGI